VTTSPTARPDTNGATPAAADAAPDTQDVDLAATAAKLAETDAAAFRSEGPRTDTKVTALLSLLAALIGTTGVLGTIGTTYSRQSGAIVAAVLLSVAAAVLGVGFVLIVLVILPKLRRRDGALGTLVEVAELTDPAAARAYYLTKATDPLEHHAAGAWLHAGLVVGRYSRIRLADLVLLARIVLGLLGGLACRRRW
jgi:hypothetical protein